MNIYYTVNIFLVVVSMAIMAVSVKYNLGMDGKRRGAMITLFAAITLASLCEWGGVMLNGTDPSLSFWHTLIKTLELSVSPFIAILCSYSIADYGNKRIITYIMLINVILEIISAFTGLIFYVDEQNVYHHGPCYWIYIVFLALGMLLFLYSGLQVTRKYQYNGGILIFLVILFIIAGFTTQFIFSDIKVDWIVLGISSIMLYKFYGDMLSQSDGLTGLLNRRGYDNFISRLNGKGAIIIFDINNFKYINDNYGHAEGDHYLREASSAICKIYNPYGRTFRIGGDEFCVVVRKKLEDIEDLDRSFHDLIKQKQLSDKNFPGISSGCAFFNNGHEDIQEAFTRADAQMYRHKESAS